MMGYNLKLWAKISKVTVTSVFIPAWEKKTRTVNLTLCLENGSGIRKAVPLEENSGMYQQVMKITQGSPYMWHCWDYSRAFYICGSL